MRKFLTVLMAVLMLAAALAVLPVAAAEVQSSKDGSTAVDANAMDLVITEVLADTQANNVAMKSKNAFQYIEIYNRGAVAVNLYDYAIVRATYNEKHPGQEWDSKKFDKKLVLDPGSIYAYYVENNVPNINLYNTPAFACNNPNDGTLNPGEVAIIWVWNADTKDVFGANGGTTASEKNGAFNTFRNHYADMGAPIPAGTKVFATFGVDGIGQSCQLNTSKNYMYALVDDSGDGFNILTEVAYSMSVGGNATRNDKVKVMWMYGTGLGMYTTTENQAAVYTLASKTPYLTNAMYDKADSDYYTSGAVDSFKEMACIYYEEGMTPGTLLPVQYADMDPTNAKAPADGAAAWKAYLDAHIDNTDRPEEDKNQDEINVARKSFAYFIGKDGKYYKYDTLDGGVAAAVEVTQTEFDTATKIVQISVENNFVSDEWYYFADTSGKYYRYKAADGSLATAVSVNKETYEAAALLIKSIEGSAFLSGEWTFFIGKDGKYYRYMTATGSVFDPVELTKAEYDTAKAATLPSTSGGSPSDEQPPVTVVNAILCGEWVYCIGSDGNYYKYVAAGGSFENAQNITKEAYDAAVNPPEEKGVPVFVWVLIGVGGAVVLMGGGALTAVLLIKASAKKSKEASTKEEDSEE